MKKFRFKTAMLRTSLLTFALASSTMGMQAQSAEVVLTTTQGEGINLYNYAPTPVNNEHQEQLTYQIDVNTLITFFDGLAYKLELKDGEGDGIDGCATLLCTNKYAFSYDGEDKGKFFDYLCGLLDECTDEDVWSKIGLTHLILKDEEYPGLGGDIVIPEKITYNEKVYKVTAIEAGAFYSGEVSQITSISLPNTITHVGTETISRATLGVGDIDEKVYDASHLFAMSLKLEKVVAPISVYEQLTAGDFANCPVLTTVATTDNPEAEGFYIPSSKKSIGQYTFTNCKKLTGVTLPNDIEIIEASAFAGTALTSITLPETLKEIHYNAFKDTPIANVVVKSVSLKQSSLEAFDNPSTIKVTVPFDYKNVFTAAGFTEANITVDENGGHKRTITEGNWGTICLPYDLDVKRDSEYGAEFYAIDRKIMNGTEVSAIELVQLEAEQTLEAGVPYFYKATGTQLVLPYKDFYTATSQPAGSVNGLHGAMDATVISDDDINDGVYMLKDNKLHKASLGSECDANCAYVKMSEVSESSSSAEGSRVFMPVNGPVSLPDGEAYTATEGQDDVDVNYTRTFNNTEWQPLYVPFNMSYNEWSEYADVAELYNVRGYDTDDDGVIDDIAIEFNKLTSGEIVPNIPYVIRAKTTGDVTFECTGKTVLAAPAEEGTVSCSSTKMTYSFHGIYQPKNDLYQTGAYHLTGGAFHQAESEAAVLKPNRFYLEVTPKVGGYTPSLMPKKIRMVVNGDDTVTGTDDMRIDMENDGIYYDLMGRQVTNPARGIYIRNGKKVILK